MASKAEKQQLIDTLKFTPTTVRLLIQGYGGEAYAGIIDRNIYDYFAQQRIDLDEYASDWDGIFNDNVPEKMQPFNPGNPYDCDGLWHASGAELSDLNSITVEEVDSNTTLWDFNLGYDNLSNAGVTVGEGGGTDLDDLAEGTVVFWGGQGEKGCFFDAEFVLTAPFDPKKLDITYENCNGWYIVTGVDYDGEELDGTGGYSTTGKWTEHKWIIVGDEEVYDSVCLEDREDQGLEWAHETGTDDPIDFPESACTSEEWDPAEELEKIELPVTDWFPSAVKPVHKGEYECEFKIVTWPWPAQRMCEWTGRTWKDATGEKVKGEFKWRGLKEKV
jgi:hypothetical protein